MSKRKSNKREKGKRKERVTASMNERERLKER